MGGAAPDKILSADQILKIIKDKYPSLYEQDLTGSTARIFKHKNFAGTVGIIAGHSRTFCASCNRLRITPDGVLKTCLYDRGKTNLTQLMKYGATDEQIVNAIVEAVHNRASDGFESQARSNRFYNLSMAQIGG